MKTILCLCLVLSIFQGDRFFTAAGEETAELTEAYSVQESLEDEERSVAGTLTLDGSYDARGALGRLWERFAAAVSGSLRKELGFAGKLLVLCLACGLCSSFSQDKRFTAFGEIASCCISVLLLSGGVEGVISQAENALFRLSDYSKAAFPAFFSTVAACGATASAAVKYASASFVMDVFLSISQRWILPLVRVYLAVSVCGSLFENALLSAAARLSKWCAVTFLSVLTMGFCAYLSLSGLISGSADAAAVKAAKTAISTVLPVVGGILSDSASALLSAASVMKNSAGVFCLIAVCAICAGPFALLAVKMLVFKAVSAVAELSCGGRLARLLRDLGTAFGLLLAMVGSGGMMLFVSFYSGIRMGTA